MSSATRIREVSSLPVFCDVLDNAITMYGFSSIESRLEKKKQEREAKKKKEKKMSWLFGKVSSAMSSWWFYFC